MARGYREAGGTGSVLLVSADEHPPYARPPLTKDYLRGESDADSLPLAEDGWYADSRSSSGSARQPPRSTPTDAGSASPTAR